MLSLTEVESSVDSPRSACRSDRRSLSPLLSKRLMLVMAELWPRICCIMEVSTDVAFLDMAGRPLKGWDDPVDGTDDNMKGRMLG